VVVREDYVKTLATLPVIGRFFRPRPDSGAKVSQGRSQRWRVRFGNYYPEEIDSTWDRYEDAESRCDELNGDDGGMWDVE
jgi:hypothetical protein